MGGVALAADIPSVPWKEEIERKTLNCRDSEPSQ